MILVDEFLDLQTGELVSLPQLKNSIDGCSNGLRALLPGRVRSLARQDFLHIEFDRYATRARLFSQPFWNRYGYFHFLL